MMARSPDPRHGFRPPFPAGAALLLTFAAAVATSSPPQDGARSGKDQAASDFVRPASVSAEGRRILDQNGEVYLLKTMSSWAMAQNCTNEEITRALSGLKALGFNAVTVSPFGVHMNDEFGDRYRNKAGQPFFTGAPYASPFGPGWSSMDWVASEAARLRLTLVFSFFLSWGNTGTVPELTAAGTTNAYDFGKTLAARYAPYPSIVWHVMGDFRWSYKDAPARELDALFHGIRDAEGSTHRLIIAEPANGSTSYDQFISQEGKDGYQWFRQDVDTVYDYGSNSVEQFDRVYDRPAAARYPVVDIEPPYVNAPHYKGQQDQELRERNYATFLRGGAGINFGHEKWWPFGVAGLFDGGPGWLNVLDEPPQRCAQHAWTLLDAHVRSKSWTRDDGAFLKTGLGGGDDKAASGYSSAAGVVYFPTRRDVVVNAAAIADGRNVRLRWYDPTTGTYTVISESEPKSSNRSIPYPPAHKDGFDDWVLVVEGL